MRAKSLAERFQAFVGPPMAAGCREWTGARDSSGYGTIGSGGRNGTTGRTLAAHRVAWELARGPIPSGLEVMHSCDNPPCVAEEHLSLGDRWENQRDAVNRRRHSNTRKTHCPHGHPYDEANTYLDPGGRRHCRSCRKAATPARIRANRNRRRQLR